MTLRLRAGRPVQTARRERWRNLAVPAARATVLSALAGAMAACGGSSSPSPSEPSSPPPAPPPSIVFVLTDDLDLLAAPSMTISLARIAEEGMTFRNAFIPTSICAASRASFLTGQFAHNHALYTNSPPRGGYEKFLEEGREGSTVATWLRAAGYRTIFIGKYLNGYPAGDPARVPPGWDDWHADYGDGDVGETGLSFYDYAMNDNGIVTSHGRDPEDYLTDVLADRAIQAIRDVPAGQPFFLYLSPRAPHEPALRAPRHDGLFSDLTVPITPNFDEPDVSDKPAWQQAIPRFSERDLRRLDQLYRDRWACLQAVDEMIGRIFQELSDQGRLASTYVLLTSDNGYMIGPHRFVHGKEAPYEESIRVPLYVRGPGIQAGQVSDAFVLNIDFAPTFAEWGRASAPDVDGRSLAGLFGGGSNTDWRADFLLEHWTKQLGRAAGDQAIPDFFGVRTREYTYVEHATGEGELYDLGRDPYQLDNQYRHAPDALIAELSSRVAALQSCRGASCR